MLSRKVLLLVCIGGFFSFLTTGAAALTVKVVPVKSQTIKWTTSYQSHVSPYLNSSISYRVSGEVKNVFVHVGDKVKRNQTMAQLSITTLKIKVLEARANLDKAQAKYDLEAKRYASYKMLYAKNHLSSIEIKQKESDFIVSKSDFLKSQAQLKVAQNDLSRATLKAPYDLVVEKRLINPGQSISKNAQAFEVYGLHKLDVEVTVSESNINAIHPGMKVDVFVKSLQRHFSGLIRSVGHKPIYASSYPVIIRILKLSADVKPGMQVSVRLAVSNPKPQVVVPLKALVGHRDFIEKQGKDIKGMGRAAVFVYDPATQTVNKVKVTVNRIKQQTALLSSGLSLGQKIVVSNTAQLKKGQKVNIKARAKN